MVSNWDRCLAGFLLLSDNAVMGMGYKFIAQCVFSFSEPSGSFSYDDKRVGKQKTAHSEHRFER